MSLALTFNMPKKSKAVGSESHVYKEDGQLDGLYTIDGAKARQEFGQSRFWQGVDEIVRLYREINPNEMAAADYDNMDRKLNNNKSTGANDSGSFREVLKLPAGLYYTLIDYEPKIFRDKKTRHQFMKRYPALRSVEVV